MLGNGPDCGAEIFMGRTIHRADYQQVLFEEAQKLGAEILLGSEVANVDSVQGQVQLKCGKLITGKVIIGADGEDLFFYSYFKNGSVN